MFFEGALELSHERPFDPDLRIPPMIFVLGMSSPFFGKAGRARDRDLAVHDEDAPMRPAICAVDPQGKRGMIISKLAAGFLHHPHIRIVEAPTRTDAVEENADFHTRSGALAKSVPELPADLIRMQDVSREVNRPLR